MAKLTEKEREIVAERVFGAAVSSVVVGESGEIVVHLKTSPELDEQEQAKLVPMTEDEMAAFDARQCAAHKASLRAEFDERQLRLIANCVGYARGDNGPPAGLPGHNLMMIVAKMAELLGMAE